MRHGLQSGIVGEMSRLGILLLRGAIIVLAFFGIGLLWSPGGLFQGHLTGAARAALSCGLFFVAWALAMQIGAQGEPAETAGHDAGTGPATLTVETGAEGPR